MRNSNKLYEPITILPPCLCPVCFKPTMAYIERDTVYALLDEDGIPGNFICDTNMTFHCISCGFYTSDYVLTDQGYRYNPFGMGDQIKEINKTLTDTRTKGNPFIKERSE